VNAKTFMGERLTVELLRMFVRLSEPRFLPVAVGRDTKPDGPGWRRGDDDGLQWLIRPAVWQKIFEPHGIDPVEAARTMSDLGLLHGQANDTLQCVVRVGQPPKSKRAYVVDGHALASWRPPPADDYRDYRDAQVQGSIPNSPSLTAIPEPANLSAMLEHGVALALQKGTEVLGMSLDPSDRQFGGLLRSQTAMVGHLLGAQIRVDEGRLRQKKADAIERISRLIEEEQERQRRLGY
jgi:hypothetical protein